MSTSRKVTRLFAAAGIAFGGVLSVDAVALAKALESGSPIAVQKFISDHSKSPYVADAIIYLADKQGTFSRGFKDSGDKGRPDFFGPPGKPQFGPPGQYFS